MGRHLSKEEQQDRLDKIIALRDEHNLDFKVIADRLNIGVSYCSQLYNKEKERRRL